jgi:CubicO group peptidase (beta-lactamase class C family)
MRCQFAPEAPSDRLPVLRCAATEGVVCGSQHLEPNATFRQRYQYNNLMFVAAGLLVERMTNRSWDDLIKQRIFEPLGMTRSNTSVRDLSQADDASLPYLLRAGRP